jgi:hypothetical protein
MAGRPVAMGLLVGSNPVPLYLSARLLEPERVLLFHTPQTEANARRLAQALRLHAIESQRIRISDPADGDEVRRAAGWARVEYGVDSLGDTGGTFGTCSRS